MDAEEAEEDDDQVKNEFKILKTTTQRPRKRPLKKALHSSSSSSFSSSSVHSQTGPRGLCSNVNTHVRKHFEGKPTIAALSFELVEKRREQKVNKTSHYGQWPVTRQTVDNPFFLLVAYYYYHLLFKNSTQSHPISEC